VFSEVGLYSGVAATDWSWCPLWMDFDNDGLKDLFISNGIPKRMNDIDYINFISNGEIQQKIRANNMQDKDMSLIEKFPEIKLPNKFFRNKGELAFQDLGDQVDGNDPSFSNGAVYADLDNDGDLDIVVNNIDAPAMVYENKNEDRTRSFLQLKLQGPPSNRNAVGARVIVFAGAQTRTYEKFPVRGFLSSMEIPLQIGLRNITPDSIILVWPDKTYQRVEGKGTMNIAYRSGLPPFDFSKLTKRELPKTFPVRDITTETGLNFIHEENHFVEFDREPLIPHMVSTEGPALCVADINKDGLEDVFIGASRDHKSAVFLQDASGRFTKSFQPALEQDSIYENVDACWADVNNDGNPDLVVATGGNEFYGKDAHNVPRIYLNDGKANFTRMQDPFDSIFMTASCVTPCDFNSDGFTDLFIGGRAMPWAYGQIPQSYLLMNNGKGKFTDVTNGLAKELAHIGFVTQALWFDIDKDGDQDLLLSLEWGKIVAFVNNKGKFTKKELTNKNGWWNSILPCDIDNDGDIDLVVGNLGWNSRLKASADEPVRLYYNDFDDNGKKEQVMTYYLEGKEIPFATKAELEKQMPVLKKKFLYAEDFAKSTLKELLGADKLEKAQVLSADYFSNAILINKGGLNFETKALPWQAQLSPFKDAIVVNANNDSLPDIFIGGNYYDNNIEMGRYDADYGTLLVNKGSGLFTVESLNGLTIKGQVRHIRKILIQNRPAYLLAKNNDTLKVIRFDSFRSSY
ncbi:MAG: VCBS repeat-containing protein, partial [Flavisolibacter sp.]